jgi:hypothetical protein
VVALERLPTAREWRLGWTWRRLVSSLFVREPLATGTVVEQSTASHQARGEGGLSLALSLTPSLSLSLSLSLFLSRSLTLSLSFSLSLSLSHSLSHTLSLSLSLTLSSLSLSHSLSLSLSFSLGGRWWPRRGSSGWLSAPREWAAWRSPTPSASSARSRTSSASAPPRPRPSSRTRCVPTPHSSPHDPSDAVLWCGVDVRLLFLITLQTLEAQ